MRTSLPAWPSTALDGPVIGLSLDGTGYGTDGRIWGGEVLICCSLDQHSSDSRILDYVPMPGGEAAIREPWRMALGALHGGGIRCCRAGMLELLGTTERRSARVCARMIERGLNSPLTSSWGACSMRLPPWCCSRRTVDYEAQAAIELEGAAVDSPDGAGCQRIYQAGISGRRLESATSRCGFSVAPLWRAILSDLAAGVKAGRNCRPLSRRSRRRVCVQLRRSARIATGIHQVALCGGCMHNRRLRVCCARDLKLRVLKFSNRAASAPAMAA